MSDRIKSIKPLLSSLNLIFSFSFLSFYVCYISPSHFSLSLVRWKVYLRDLYCPHYCAIYIMEKLKDRYVPIKSFQFIWCRSFLFGSYPTAKSDEIRSQYGAYTYTVFRKNTIIRFDAVLRWFINYLNDRYPPSCSMSNDYFSFIKRESIVHTKSK